MTHLILGTRGSELALAQTVLTTAALRATSPSLDVTRTIIKTSGDLRPDLRLSDFSKGDTPVLDKGIFTRELENALQAGTIHAAVHSLKDVPTFLGPGFRISAVLPRAPIEDVLISKTPGGLEGLPDGSVIGTSSVRRVRLLKHLRPGLHTAEIRGNVPTRLEKAASDPQLNAIILAQAGLQRLGLFQDLLQGFSAPLYLTVLPAETFLPAASQGAVALETWEETAELRGILEEINHPETFARISAERTFLELLQAGCQTPVGIHTHVTGNGMSLKALVFPEDGGPPTAASVTHPADDPSGAARLLFESLQPSAPGPGDQ